jgi:hypothetical protein
MESIIMAADTGQVLIPSALVGMILAGLRIATDKDHRNK